ncbi:hypothetical protein [Tropicimonas isoalkanivorans]|uniref:Uncharacterized protein n=1 Tax=Tropicimonas isoalkanivorans TaxID=441112 RepID=A0A1I1QPU8_9RHOB|nr:hypothetical protein [Tropicimonas isoalkanivorans]SFD24146.1 hypothetical protein SAMN04488094_12238 [Tropicimonas isoalkanivorans]
MRNLHNIVILILVVCVLPWGAYAGALSAKATPKWAVATQHPSDDMAVIAAEAGSTLKAERPPKACRKGMLPGSPCGPDLAIPITAARCARAPALRLLRPDPGCRRTGMAPPGQLDPPRLI